MKDGVVRNCLVIGNRNHRMSKIGGLWLDGGRAENCTVVGNSGGIRNSGGHVENCIVYYNEGFNVDGTCESSCTTPDPGGPNNITDVPGFLYPPAGVFALLEDSPCIDAGVRRSWMEAAVDYDGVQRIIGPQVDIGCSEFGPLRCDFALTPMSGTAPLSVSLAAYVSGTNVAGVQCTWDVDLASPTNSPLSGGQIAHVFDVPGSYSVSLCVSNSAGEVARRDKYDRVAVGPAIAYVSSKGSEVRPYTSWETAAGSIQKAIDVGEDGTVVLVAEGTYIEHFRVRKAITVQSLSGSDKTIVRCRNPSLASGGYAGHPGALIRGFTFTDFTYGGVQCNLGGTVTDCVITGNWHHTSFRGVGAFIINGGRLLNSVVAYNRSHSMPGGGVYCNGGVISNCIIRANRGASQGGGVYCGPSGGRIAQCTIYENQSVGAGSGVYAEGLTYIDGSVVYGNVSAGRTNVSNLAGDLSCSYTCTEPSVDGPGNIAGNPLLSPDGPWGSSLARTSPCIDAGRTASGRNRWRDVDAVAGPLDGDNDGIPRRDIGASEYVHPEADTDHDGMRDAWEVAWTLNPRDNDGALDSDGDGVSNIDEYLADTVPRDPDSYLHIRGVRMDQGAPVIEWQGGINASQWVEYTRGLTAGTLQWRVLWTNLPPTSQIETFVDTSVYSGPVFYRIRAARK